MPSAMPSQSPALRLLCLLLAAAALSNGGDARGIARSEAPLPRLRRRPTPELELLRTDESASALVLAHPPPPPGSEDGTSGSNASNAIPDAKGSKGRGVAKRRGASATASAPAATSASGVMAESLLKHFRPLDTEVPPENLPTFLSFGTKLARTAAPPSSRTNALQAERPSTSAPALPSALAERIRPSSISSTVTTRQSPPSEEEVHEDMDVGVQRAAEANKPVYRTIIRQRPTEASRRKSFTLSPVSVRPLVFTTSTSPPPPLPASSPSPIRLHHYAPRVYATLRRTNSSNFRTLTRPSPATPTSSRPTTSTTAPVPTETVSSFVSRITRTTQSVPPAVPETTTVRVTSTIETPKYSTKDSPKPQVTDTPVLSETVPQLASEPLVKKTLSENSTVVEDTATEVPARNESSAKKDPSETAREGRANTASHTGPARLILPLRADAGEPITSLPRTPSYPPAFFPGSYSSSSAPKPTVAPASRVLSTAVVTSVSVQGPPSAPAGNDSYSMIQDLIRAAASSSNNPPTTETNLGTSALPTNITSTSSTTSTTSTTTTPTTTTSTTTTTTTTTPTTTTSTTTTTTTTTTPSTTTTTTTSPTTTTTTTTTSAPITSTPTVTEAPPEIPPHVPELVPEPPEEDAPELPMDEGAVPVQKVHTNAEHTPPGRNEGGRGGYSHSGGAEWSTTSADRGFEQGTERGSRRSDREGTRLDAALVAAAAVACILPAALASFALARFLLRRRRKILDESDAYSDIGVDGGGGGGGSGLNGICRDSAESGPDGDLPCDLPVDHLPRAQLQLPGRPDCEDSSGGSAAADAAARAAALAAAGVSCDARWEFPRARLRLQTVLGQGNFGQVLKAEADDLSGHQGTTRLVAVKTVKPGASARDKADLLRELAILQSLGEHPNVVTLLGCCTEQEPYLLILEYVMYGKLLAFLRDHRSRRHRVQRYDFGEEDGGGTALTARDLAVFGYCVARGMEFLAARGVIHRDLAARNVLVDHNRLCKIADFGMARSVREQGDVYEQRRTKGALPIRWMAPESLLHRVFTHKSDVWSFGVLLWEIVTLGSTPYPGLGAREVVRRVRAGGRLERPQHCRPQLYRVMARCWASDPARRPDFTELKRELGALVEAADAGVDLDRMLLQPGAAIAAAAAADVTKLPLSHVPTTPAAAASDATAHGHAPTAASSLSALETASDSTGV